MLVADSRQSSIISLAFRAGDTTRPREQPDGGEKYAVGLPTALAD
jgi:hypothetical protein